MTLIKLLLDEFDEVDYELIAIHSSLEDYRMAFFINQNLPIILSKSKEEIIVKVNNEEVLFSKFIYDDLSNDLIWTLIQNKNEIITKEKTKNQTLFLDTEVEIETKVFLLPELKKVDYFLKIENVQSKLEFKKTISKLLNIDQISTAYKVDVNTIKSKNNLIF
ncbi:MAG: IPExxxVDY family protein [Flavobacterium sp.]|nr:IPExxxVDY family protein [Flavobacterium sp.]